MGCGCRKGVKRGQTMRMGGTMRSAPGPRTSVELRKLAAKKTVNQVMANKEKTSGGMDKNRRELDRKRRMVLLQKLGRV